MTIDYQVVINLVCTILVYAFPIALIFMVAQKLVSMLTNLMFGKDVNL